MLPCVRLSSTPFLLIVLCQWAYSNVSILVVGKILRRITSYEYQFIIIGLEESEPGGMTFQHITLNLL